MDFLLIYWNFIPSRVARTGVQSKFLRLFLQYFVIIVLHFVGLPFCKPSSCRPRCLVLRKNTSKLRHLRTPLFYLKISSLLNAECIMLNTKFREDFAYAKSTIIIQYSLFNIHYFHIITVFSSPQKS